MPYIEQNRRAIFNKHLEGLLDSSHIEKGDLTYCVYHLALQYIQVHGQRYQHISDACSALADAEAEIRRRILNPYEDKKIVENGDVNINPMPLGGGEDYTEPR